MEHFIPTFDLNFQPYFFKMAIIVIIYRKFLSYQTFFSHKKILFLLALSYVYFKLPRSQ
jgi:hypothetical protein